MSPAVDSTDRDAGGTSVPPVVQPSAGALRWLIGLRLVVVSALFLGVLVIQVNTRQILPLRDLYALILVTYGLSLAYLALYARRVSSRLQAVAQLVGDTAVVTGFVYVTGGVYSPFSFLYLMVIVAAAVLLRGGGLVFAGLAAVAYGILIDLMVFEIIPIPPNLSGLRVALPTSRVLYQLLTHFVGFVAVAVLVSYLTESLRTAHRRLAEEHSRAARLLALTDHVVRSVGSGILATDLDRCVLHVNPAAAAILGLDHQSTDVGRLVDEVMPLEGQSWVNLCGRARARPITRIEAIHPPSGHRLGLALGPLRNEQSELVGFIVTFQNLSEVEREMERRRLQERMAAVGEMAARMAHEIKNPLASISGSAQMLASFDRNDDTDQRLLSIVVSESRRLSSILDEFLGFARPRGGNLRRCELEPVVGEVVDLLRRSSELLPEHRLQVDIPPGTAVVGEESLLRQVCWNLTRNALQAMPQGGVLAISAEVDECSVVLYWRDTGVGMSEEMRQQAFEPFVTGRPEGTGLGLAVVYAAVEEHGGSLDINSRLGEGTTVRVELQRAEEWAP